MRRGFYSHLSSSTPHAYWYRHWLPTGGSKPRERTHIGVLVRTMGPDRSMGNVAFAPLHPHLCKGCASRGPIICSYDKGTFKIGSFSGWMRPPEFSWGGSGCTQRAGNFVTKLPSLYHGHACSRPPKQQPFESCRRRSARCRCFRSVCRMRTRTRLSACASIRSCRPRSGHSESPLKVSISRLDRERFPMQYCL